jgi:hypothetical protein
MTILIYFLNSIPLDVSVDRDSGKRALRWWYKTVRGEVLATVSTPIQHIKLLLRPQQYWVYLNVFIILKN